MCVWLQMITGRKKQHYPAAQVIPYLGFALLFLLFFWRAFRGFDWSDESASYATVYRLLLGDRPLLDSWDSHAGWSMLAAPFLWLYLEWNGSMDGVLLAGRLLFLLVQTAVGVIVYRRLTGFCRSHLAAMLAGWLTAAFVPGMIFNFSYESVGLLLMVLSTTGLVWGYRREAERVPRTVLASGIFAGLSIVVYPTFLPAVLLMAVTLILYRIGTQKKGFASFLPFFLFLCGVLLPVVLHLVCLGNWIGWKNLWEHSQWLITSRLYPFSGYSRAFFSFFKAYSQADFLYLAEISLLLVLLLFKWAPFSVDLPFRMEDIFYAVVKVALPVCILANVVLIIVQPDWDVPSNIKMGYLLAGTGIRPAILCVQNPNRRTPILLFSMYLPGQLMALGAYLSDRPSGFGASFAMLPSTLAAVLIVYENYGPLLRKASRGSMETVVAVIRTCMAMVALFLLGTIIVIRSALAYRDLPVSELNTQMTTGPARGIYTTEIDAQAYESMVAEIRETESGREHVLFVGNLPFGYLCGETPPAAPMVENLSLNSTLLYDYLAANLDRRPDWIYVPKGIYGYGNENNTSSTRKVQWVASGTVSVQESAYSWIYVTEDKSNDPDAIKNIVNPE